ncbi:unnamed protein product [Amoebophrya sp. A25]|nr:unnamed protein product [Amoebophrya sp. A25]|eukprot:GSA25T00000283001.1
MQLAPLPEERSDEKANLVPCVGDSPVLTTGKSGQYNLLDRDRRTLSELIAFTLYNFPLGVVLGVSVTLLSLEAETLAPENSSLLLGIFCVLAGVAQLVCPPLGKLSDRCRSKWGKRTPYMTAFTVPAMLSFVLMWYASTSRSLYGYVFAYTMMMVCVSAAQTASLGFVADMVPPQQRGEASGVSGAMWLLGALAGNFCLQSVAFINFRLLYAVLPVMLFLAWAVMVMVVSERDTSQDEITASDEMSLYAELKDCFYIGTTSHGTDFFFVVLGRTFYYCSVASQIFIFFYIRDFLTQDRNILTYNMAGVAIVCYCIGVVGSLGIGALSDVPGYGRKRMVYLSCIVMCAACVMLLFFPYVCNGNFDLPKKTNAKTSSFFRYVEERSRRRPYAPSAAARTFKLQELAGSDVEQKEDQSFLEDEVSEARGEFDEDMNVDSSKMQEDVVSVNDKHLARSRTPRHHQHHNGKIENNHRRKSAPAVASHEDVASASSLLDADHAEQLENNKHPTPTLLARSATTGLLSSFFELDHAVEARKKLRRLHDAFINVPWQEPQYRETRGWCYIFLTAMVYALGNGAFIAVDCALALDTLPNKENATTKLGVWSTSHFIGFAIGPIFYGVYLHYAAHINDESASLTDLLSAEPTQFNYLGYALTFSTAMVFQLICALLVFKIKGST